MIPFRLLQIEGWPGKKEYLYQVTANVLLFVPIGFLLMWMGKGIRRVWAKALYIVFAFIAGVAFSVLVEASQYYLRRGLCETDDVIHNTIGVGVGILLCIVFDKIKRKCKVNRDRRSRIGSIR